MKFLKFTEIDWDDGLGFKNLREVETLVIPAATVDHIEACESPVGARIQVKRDTLNHSSQVQYFTKETIEQLYEQLK